MPCVFFFVVCAGFCSGGDPLEDGERTFLGSKGSIREHQLWVLPHEADRTAVPCVADVHSELALAEDSWCFFPHAMPFFTRCTRFYTSLLSLSLSLHMGVGQNYPTRKPQVLVFVSIYQGSISGTYF